MAHFNYYKTGSTGAWIADRCFRIVRPDNSEVWDKTLNSGAGGMGPASSVAGANFANGNIAITFVPGMQGYAVNLPTTLPVGEYDLLFYNAAPANLTANDEIEESLGCKWNGTNLKAPIERLVDRLK